MRSLAFAAPFAMLSATAQAAVTISNGATDNIICSGGVCAPTAKSAVLNAGDLETLLASGSVTVTTTGSGVQASDLAVKAALTWSASTTLTLDAHRSLVLDRSISVAGTGGLALLISKDGSYAFGRGGKVTFASLSGSLSIDGTGYTLENTISSLAAAIAANPSGDFALAADYDASQDGTYTTVPIPTTFTGTFEGLGNAISNLTIDDTNDEFVGLFYEIGAGATVRDLALAHANVAAAGDALGILAGVNEGTVVDAMATGAASNGKGQAGGLIGANVTGIIADSRANVVVSGTGCGGGLVGTNGATISESYASGNVSSSIEAGGLTCDNNGGAVENSYSTGAALGGRKGSAGGFEGGNEGTTSASFSTGEIAHVRRGDHGGFVGYDLDSGDIKDCYWDTDKSGFTNLHRGAGNRKDDPGIEGLTTQQLQSGLPTGFDPTIWGENADINGGLPYLLANPPS